MAVELEASASIGIAIGSKLDDISALLKKEDPKPSFFDVPGSGVGAGAIRIGRPPSNKVWNILTITVTSADDHTVVASGFVSLYIDSDPFNLGLGQCKVPALAIPSFTSISRGTLWAHSGGEVVANAVGTGITATTPVNVTIGIAEWTVRDVARMNTK